MQTVTSKDGTTIAYSKIGSGPAVVLVDGAFGYRVFGPNGALAELLAPYFTVYTYDRRGRGESGDTKPFSKEREIEDLAALIDMIGDEVYVYGISSGAGLALEAANHKLNITKLALYEAPFIVDESRAPLPTNYVAQMNSFIASHQYGKVVKLFMGKGVGVPSIFVFMMQLMPAWKQMKAIAPTVAYDTAFVIDNQQSKALNAEQWHNVTMPTKVIVGGKSDAWMKNGMSMLAKTLPNATHDTLEGQTHIVDARVLAPVIIDFFNA